MRQKLFPIRNKEIWKHYKDQEANEWNTNDIEFSNDKKDWEKLDDRLKSIMEIAFVFFQQAEKMVIENVADISEMIPDEDFEVKKFLALQERVENVHDEFYELIVEHLISDERFEQIIKESEYMKKRVNIIRKYFTKGASLEQLIIANMLVEGLTFHNGFVPVLKCKTMGILNETTLGNDWVLRDETAHYLTFESMLKIYTKNVNNEMFIRMLKDFVEMEDLAAKEMLKNGEFEDITLENLMRHTRVIANYILRRVGLEEIYEERESLFSPVQINGLKNKANTFDTRTQAEYQMNPVIGKEGFVISDEIYY